MTLWELSGLLAFIFDDIIKKLSFVVRRIKKGF